MSRREPGALRASLDARLLVVARERGQDVNRLRRQLTFQRVLRRLDTSWVLKGGYLLEARLGTRARATRDLDLARATTTGDLADAFTEALENDVDGDGFVFQVSAAHPHLADTLELGGPGARLSVAAVLAGRVFARIRVDIVARPGETEGGTEQLTLPAVVLERGWPPVTVVAVDLPQHVAEKLHALTAVDSHPRPSTRVKDLLDIVLALEAGGLDETRLHDRVRVVFAARDGRPPPPDLPDPPAAWEADYAGLAAEHMVSARTVIDAMAVVRALYVRSLDQSTPPKEQQ